MGGFAYRDRPTADFDSGMDTDPPTEFRDLLLSGLVLLVLLLFTFALEAEFGFYATKKGTIAPSKMIDKREEEKRSRYYVTMTPQQIPHNAWRYGGRVSDVVFKWYGREAAFQKVCARQSTLNLNGRILSNIYRDDRYSFKLCLTGGVAEEGTAPLSSD